MNENLAKAALEKIEKQAAYIEQLEKRLAAFEQIAAELQAQQPTLKSAIASALRNPQSPPQSTDDLKLAADGALPLLFKKETS